MRRSFALTFFSIVILTGCANSEGFSSAPVTAYGASQGEGSSGVHIVQGGDTLYSISERYDIAMNEIVYSNDMNAPFMLNAGQRIKLPPPNDYRVRGGDSLYSISRLFDTSTSEIARMNNLSAPYTLRAGQKLTLPGNPALRQRRAAPTYREAALQKPLDLRPQSPRQHNENTKAPADINRGVVPQPKPIRQASIRPPRIDNPPARSSSTFLKPVNGRIISSYGPKDGGLHNDGINIAAPFGAKVSAAENGVVVYTGSELKGYGNLVLVRHDGGYMTAYAHMDSVNVTKGQIVKRGESLGKVGSTGSVSKPQLHFEVRKGTKAINPQKYL